ncbi:hypothetical protein JB92DRAFT_2827298 [Gautieria morchelliformis]|nr:hypothetical protein JB92DRAFT_2827298 [Gautieria morchelliformis]
MPLVQFCPISGTPKDLNTETEPVVNSQRWRSLKPKPKHDSHPYPQLCRDAEYPYATDVESGVTAKIRHAFKLGRQRHDVQGRDGMEACTRWKGLGGGSDLNSENGMYGIGFTAEYDYEEGCQVHSWGTSPRLPFKGGNREVGVRLDAKDARRSNSSDADGFGGRSEGGSDAQAQQYYHGVNVDVHLPLPQFVQTRRKVVTSLGDRRDVYVEVELEYR